MRKYNSNPGYVDGRLWTQVWLGHAYFERLNEDDTHEISDLAEMTRLTNWMEDNLAADSWQADGVSRYSYRFWFRNPEDAVMFKLVMGLP